MVSSFILNALSVIGFQGMSSYSPHQQQSKKLSIRKIKQDIHKSVQQDGNLKCIYEYYPTSRRVSWSSPTACFDIPALNTDHAARIFGDMLDLSKCLWLDSCVPMLHVFTVTKISLWSLESQRWCASIQYLLLGFAILSRPTLWNYLWRNDIHPLVGRQDIWGSCYHGLDMVDLWDTNLFCRCSFLVDSRLFERNYVTSHDSDSDGHTWSCDHCDFRPKEKRDLDSEILVYFTIAVNRGNVHIVLRVTKEGWKTPMTIPKYIQLWDWFRGWRVRQHCLAPIHNGSANEVALYSGLA